MSDEPNTSVEPASTSADAADQPSTSAGVGKKTITFVIPCYNSAEYMDHCIQSILGVDKDIEIIIVDDGSSDATAQKADAWAQHSPNIIRVIHQENSGHGGAVMAGLRAARGEYFKVVDSDDWLDRTSRGVLLARLRHFISTGADVDLVVCNYVYEHVLTGSRKVIRYRGALPANKIISWDDIGTFGIGQYIMMHAAIYRTQVLRDSGLDLPKHTFYVDNVLVYQPLPYVNKLYYLPVNLYRYFIGREDQSVNERVMLGRLDQQMRVTKILADSYALPEDISSPRLARYMFNYLMIIVTASSIFATIRGDAEALDMRKAMWENIEAKSPRMAKKLRHHPLVWGANRVSPLGTAAAKKLYRLAQHLYHFN
ncbi:MAG: glycosyltransferase family A protein [Actinomycetaceae bacterium]|nr:glycosyltransferase family 2 protein [Arcanobacterium sp.]MDD7687437.1 glycosyltransferase family A protein [Actinomycetaceae bacterium]MDY5272911.1 glycosyltransferase family A protein [Arcanobacterium sp.]